MDRGFSLNRCRSRTCSEAVMFVTRVIAGTYLVAGFWPRLRFTSAFVAPALLASGVFALQPRLDEPGPEFELERAAVSLHVALVLLAYAAFGLASLAAALYLVRERPGGSARVRALAARLPATPRMEEALLRSLGLGLVLLTAGLVMSFGLMRERYGVLVRPDPKIAWSLVVWAVYLGLMVLRLKFRQDGRRLAWGALGGLRLSPSPFGAPTSCPRSIIPEVWRHRLTGPP
jgi:ABC-type uncharacterized transport system permease subunit